MPPTSANAILLVLVLLTLVVPTNAAVPDDRPWDGEGIVLAPHGGPNGKYADVDAGGNLTIDLDGEGVNANAEFAVEDLFNVSNDASERYSVWITHDAMDRVVFRDGSGPIQGAANATEVGPGETIEVGMEIDTRGVSTGTDLLGEITVHARRSSTPTPTPTSDDSDGDTSPGESPPTPTPDEETTVEVGTVRVEFEEELRPNESVDVSPRGELPPDRGEGVEAVIRRESVRGPGTATAEPIEALGVDSIAIAGEPATFSASGTVVGQAAGIDRERRAVAVYDITVPDRLRDDPATIWFKMDRSRFGEDDPADALAARYTGEGWQLLETDLVDGNETAVVLRSHTPGFSTFAVFPGNELQFHWEIDEHGSTAGERAVVTYDEPGYYEATLTVTDALGRSDRTTHRMFVDDRPTVRIERPGSITAGEPVTLRANVSNEFGETTIEWRFADGTTAAGPEVTRTFEEGVHPVEVVVSDEYGATGRASQELVVGPEPVVEVVEFALGLEGRVGLLALAALAAMALLRRAQKRWSRGRRR